MSGIGTLTLAESTSADAVVVALAALAEGDARVVVIEAAADGDAGAWPGEQVRWLWRDYPLPVVFAFEGRLAGAGAALALGCDLRVCGEEAVMELDGGSMDDLTAERTRTLLRLEAGDAIPARFTAGEALEAGLVSRVGPAGNAGELARGAAEAVAARGPIGLAGAGSAARTGPAIRNRFDLAPASDQRSG